MNRHTICLLKPKYAVQAPSGRGFTYRESPNWAMKFRDRTGRQVMKSLGTPNRVAALNRGKQIFRELQEQAWSVLKPKLPGAHRHKIEEVITLFRQFAAEQGIKDKTVREYVGNLKILTREAEVDSVERLRETIGAWKASQEKRMSSTVASMIQQASGVFSKRALAYYAENGMQIDSPFARLQRKQIQVAPFQGYERSAIAVLVDKARRELKPVDLPAYLGFVLCIGAGARQQEAAWARWRHMTPQGILWESSDAHETKSGRSRLVPVGPKLMGEILSFRPPGISGDEFVIQENAPVAMRSKCPAVRAMPIFKRLAQWLRANGVKDQKPVHVLRKIFGSLVATQEGLFAARDLLGHSTVRVTEASYAALLKKPVIDVGDIVIDDAAGNPKPGKESKPGADHVAA
jgi:integrase